MKQPNNQHGSLRIVIIVLAILVILGTLGYVAWTKFFTSSRNSQPAAPTQQAATTARPCEEYSNAIEKDGVVCSAQIGIKFTIPSIFDSKFEKVDNYEVFKGTVDYATRTSDGDSIVVYSAVVSGNDSFTLTIAQEPLRSGYVDVGNALQSTYYDEGTGLLSNVTSPTQNYNSATNSYTTTGSYAIADTVPSFEAGGVKIYHGVNEDAGVRIETYFAVINGSIVKIKLTNNAYMGPEDNDPSTIDADQIFDMLNASVKKIELLHS